MADPSISELRAMAASLPPTKACATFAAALGWQHLDADARLHAGRHFLDTLGAAIAGATQSATETVVSTLKLAGEAGSDMPMPVPGRPASGMGLLAATHMMGTAAHGLELDDGYRPGMMHPGCVVVPAALLLGARLEKSGKEMLTAIAAGYEVACRISAATHPRARWRGFHPTSAAGVFAAAATAGNLLRLTAGQMESAMGIAASSSAGLFTFLDGGDVKRLHGGLGAREGLFAALLASQGLIGPPNALESGNGYLHSHAGGDLPENDYSELKILAAGGPADSFAVTQCYLKPYASCRHIHGPVEMLLALRARHGLQLADIDSIHVGTYAVAAAHGAPGWSEMTTAQMSMRYVLAVALARGKVTPAQFSDAERADPGVTAFCSRVFTSVDDDCEARYPGLRPARITVTLKNGRTLAAEVDEPPGEPGRRLSDSGVEEKFGHLAEPVVGKQAIERILAHTRDLANCANVDELLQLCVPLSTPRHSSQTVSV
ncbi:MmgE/PrpD family protein [Bordetella sp. BOR01]|uniref:MmgE/PrpD family protein n=1 Tax=Bordetella sp. BOR01 TaxID=2854779 RepID=UPI001C44B13C|nr:MmgE/PrpD family protein [Bordetella sp. BOR01]MBV7483141.1 MmgE/PrpD family protein [Bordetella sp. BOR01]